MSHLGGVQEVARIPVLESGGCFQFQPGPIHIAFVAIDQVQQGERLDALDDAPARRQQPQSIRDFVLRWWLIEDPRPLPDQAFVPVFEQRISGGLLFQPREIRR